MQVEPVEDNVTTVFLKLFLIVSFLRVYHSVSASHLFICIATHSPSLKHCVSLFTAFPLISLSIYLLPPPSPSLPSSPMLSSSTPPNHLQHCQQLNQSMETWGYLTHHWSCWSAPSKVLLAVWKRLIFTQTHARTNLHVWLIGSWLMLSERFTVCVACLNTNTSNKYFNYCNIFAPFLYFFSLLHHKTG